MTIVPHAMHALPDLDAEALALVFDDAPGDPVVVRLDIAGSRLLVELVGVALQKIDRRNDAEECLREQHPAFYSPPTPAPPKG